MGADQQPHGKLLRMRRWPAFPQRHGHGDAAEDGHLLRLHAAIVPLAFPGTLWAELDRRPPSLWLQRAEPAEEGQLSATAHARRRAAEHAQVSGIWTPAH